MTTPNTTTKEVIRRGIANSLYEEILDPSRAYFMVLGRSFDWDSNTGVLIGGETVPYPTDDVETFNESNRNAFFAKRVSVNDVRLMLPLVQWKRGTRYAKYASNVNVFDENYLFYVCTADGSVYKCLENGRDGYQTGVPSLHEPSVKDTRYPFTTPDGYKWKYMFTVPQYDRRLITAFSNETNYIPVSRPSGNYYYGENILQFEVQENAVPGTVDTVFLNPDALLSGTGADLCVSSAKSLAYVADGASGATAMTLSGPALSAQTNAYRDFTITITSGPGAGVSRVIGGYNKDSKGITFSEPLPVDVVRAQYQIAPTLKIYGDGTGAEGYLKLTERPLAFGIKNFVVTNPGRDYTYAFVGDPQPSGITFINNFWVQANISPKFGHGFDAITELNPTYLQVCVDINGGETASTLRLADGKFRQIMLLKNPLLWNSSRIAGTENKDLTELFVRTTSATANLEPMTVGNYLFGETSRFNGKIQGIRNNGTDWILTIEGLNGVPIQTSGGVAGESVSVYSHTVGSEFKRLSKDIGHVVSAAPYLPANATNQVYKLTTTVGLTGVNLGSPTTSQYSGGYAYQYGISADKFNARIFSIRTVSGGSASHLVELTGVVGLDAFVERGATGSLSLDAPGVGTNNDGSGQIVSISPPAFEPLSGEIVYIENTEGKERERIQTERISILIKI